GQGCELPCSHDPAFSCELPCGNPLACGNHACQLACHVITRPRTADGQRVLVAGEGDEGGEEEEEGGVREVEEGGEEGRNLLRDTCYPCKRACQKPRDPPCVHPCPESCHPGSCPPCKNPLRKRCYCGIMTHAIECGQWGAATEAERIKMVSCTGPCHKKLPFCSHMCVEMCHPGPCPKPTQCRKKVTVRCACLRLKREWLCSQMRLFHPYKVRRCAIIASPPAAACCWGGPQGTTFTHPLSLLSLTPFRFSHSLPLLSRIPSQPTLRPPPSIAHHQGFIPPAVRRWALTPLSQPFSPPSPSPSIAHHQGFIPPAVRRWALTPLSQPFSPPSPPPSIAHHQGFIPPAVRRWAVIITLLCLLLLLLIAAGVGLKALSDWMNERDRLRPRKSFRY
ncbi:unnamed protein product, partial [Closterium sp. Naga37s-1]